MTNKRKPVIDEENNSPKKRSKITGKAVMTFACDFLWEIHLRFSFTCGSMQQENIDSNTSSYNYFDTFKHINWRQFFRA